MGSEGGDYYGKEETKGGLILVRPAGYRILERSPIRQPQNNNHNSVKKFLNLLGFLAAVAVACVVLYQSMSSFQALTISSFTFSMQSDESIFYSAKDRVKLERVLEKSTMGNKTVIITTLNEAWAAQNSTFDLFLESFRIGNQTKWLLNHLLVVALDQKAYDVCQKLHPNCYYLRTVGSDFSGEACFMAPDYLKMMWRRINFLRAVLDMGYSFIFTDVDIMWFRNPFPRFFPKADFQIACDQYYGKPNDLGNAPNGGFTYVKSNSRTRQFYEFWYRSKDAYPGKHDQDVLNKIKYDSFINKIGLRMKFLDTAYFGGFCQPSKDLDKVCTMHANCCVGLDNKVHDLKILLQDWRKYLDHKKYNSSEVSSWSVPQNCGARSFQQRNRSKSKRN